MKCFVTGGAGFVGANLVKQLLLDGHHVVVYDNFSTGKSSNINGPVPSGIRTVIPGDITDKSALIAAMRHYPCDIVFHLAANADIRHGLKCPTRDLEQNTIGTFNVLEAMRANDIRRIAFASTCSVYGNVQVHPTPENAPFPVQISLYGASKLAGEGLVQAYCEGYDFQGYIYRFTGMLGEYYSHGHIIDWHRQICQHLGLKILGNGTVRKSYLYVKDAVSGILTGVEKGQEKVNIFNLGTDEVYTVRESANLVCEYMDVPADRIKFSSEDTGWVGDNPFVYLDCSKIRAMGWQPTLSIKESVLRTLDYLSGAKQ